MASLRALIEGDALVMAPLVFDAMSALMAEQAGFFAGYVGGASTGYRKGTIEALLFPGDLGSVAIEIRTRSSLALIMDGGVGWGDALHIVRVIAMAEAAGFSAIEIEDQVAPKRAHHHVGVEHLVPAEIMADKIREAVAARRSRDFLIIARTNAAGRDVEEACRRCDVYAAAGADLIFPITSRIDQMLLFGRRAPAPLMQMVHPGQSFAAMGIERGEMLSLNYRLLVDGLTPFAALYGALGRCYRGLQTARPDPNAGRSLEQANVLVDLERLLSIERRTTEGWGGCQREKGTPGLC